MILNFTILRTKSMRDTDDVINQGFKEKILDLKKGWRFHILDFEFGYSEFNTLPDTFYFENYIPVLRMQCSIYPVWSLDRISQMLIWISMELFECNENRHLTFQTQLDLSNTYANFPTSMDSPESHLNLGSNFPTSSWTFQQHFSTIIIFLLAPLYPKSSSKLKYSCCWKFYVGRRIPILIS